MCVIFVCYCLNLNNMQIVVLGVVGSKMAIDFGSEEVEPMLDEGDVHGQPTYCFGTVKTVRVDGWTELSMCVVYIILLKNECLEICAEKDR